MPKFDTSFNFGANKKGSKSKKGGKGKKMTQKQKENAARYANGG